jgi:hypothetical protein
MFTHMEEEDTNTWVVEEQLQEMHHQEQKSEALQQERLAELASKKEHNQVFLYPKID